MKTYLWQRLLLFLPTLLGMTLLTFLLGVVSPADPAMVVMTMDGMSAPSAEELLLKRHEMGLDQSYVMQYFSWMAGVLHGRWGVSFIDGKDVLGTLLAALPVTLSVTSMAIFWVMFFSIPLGAVMAVCHLQWPDRFLLLVSMALTSVPGFWLAIIAMQVLCENLRIFPTSGYGSLRNLLLPGLILGVGTIGAVMRLQRDALLAVFADNYILTARAKGLPFFYIIYKHGLRNSFITVVTMLGNYISGLLGGAAIIEMIFSLPGLGTLVLAAVQARDYPMIQGYVLMVGCMTIFVNMGVDVLYVLLKPQLRLEGRRDYGCR